MGFLILHHTALFGKVALCTAFRCLLMGGLIYFDAISLGLHIVTVDFNIFGNCLVLTETIHNWPFIRLLLPCCADLHVLVAAFLGGLLRGFGANRLGPDGR